MTNHDPYYASVHQFLIQEILEGNAISHHRDACVERLEAIRQKYTVSEKRRRNDEEVVLWVSGLNPVGRTLGQYVRLWVAPDSTRYCIRHEVIDVPYKEHPRRKFIKHANPNWGHPLFRKIKNGKRFDSASEVITSFRKLKSDYPNAVVLASEKILVYVYGRTEDGTGVTSFAFSLEKLDSGGVIVRYKKSASGTRIGASDGMPVGPRSVHASAMLIISMRAQAQDAHG